MLKSLVVNISGNASVVGKFHSVLIDSIGIRRNPLHWKNRRHTDDNSESIDGRFRVDCIDDALTAMIACSVKYDKVTLVQYSGGAIPSCSYLSRTIVGVTAGLTRALQTAPFTASRRSWNTFPLLR